MDGCSNSGAFTAPPRWLYKSNGTGHRGGVISPYNRDGVLNVSLRMSTHPSRETMVAAGNPAESLQDAEQASNRPPGPAEYKWGYITKVRQNLMMVRSKSPHIKWCGKLTNKKGERLMQRRLAEGSKKRTFGKTNKSFDNLVEKKA